MQIQQHQNGLCTHAKLVIYKNSKKLWQMLKLLVLTLLTWNTLIFHFEATLCSKCPLILFSSKGVCVFFLILKKKSKLKWNLRIDSTWNCSWIFDFTRLFFFLRCVWLQVTYFSPPKFASWFIKNHSEHQPLWRGAAATIEYFFHACQLQKEGKKKKGDLLLLSRRLSSFSIWQG